MNVNTGIRSLPKGASSLREEMSHGSRSEDLSRIELTKKILENIEEYYLLLKKQGFKPIIEEWKELSAMLGSRIKVVLPNRTFEGQVHNIDEHGSLVVRTEAGILERVSSGDIVMAR